MKRQALTRRAISSLCGFVPIAESNSLIAGTIRRAHRDRDTLSLRRKLRYANQTDNGISRKVSVGGINEDCVERGKWITEVGHSNDGANFLMTSRVTSGHYDKRDPQKSVEQFSVFRTREQDLPNLGERLLLGVF